MTTRTIAVTGASGNVGTALLRRLAERHPDWGVVGVCRRPPSAGEPAYARVSWRPVDLSGAGAQGGLAAAFDGVDAVVHAAWRIQPGRDRQVLEATNVGGTRRVLDAARAAAVGHLVHLSSVGAYAGSTKSVRRDESWPTTGVASSSYSRDKVAAERVLDQAPPEVRVTRLRPGLILQRDAGSEIARYFLGSLVPQRLVGAARLPVVPLPGEATVQVVHAEDVAEAIVRALERRPDGAVNLAAEPVLTPDRLAALLGGRPAQVPAAVVRGAATATYRLRLQPTEPGWVDLAFSVPVLDCSRASSELGWEPRWSSDAAVADLLAGLRAGAGTSAPVLAPRRRPGWRRAA